MDGEKIHITSMEKISFGFIKTEKVEKPFTPIMTEEKRDSKECVEEKSIKVVGCETVAEDLQLVIPMKPNTPIMAEEKLKQIPEKVDSTVQEPEIKEEPVIKEEMVEEYETLEQMAVTELMQEARKDVKVEVPATLAIPAPAKSVMTEEKVSTLDDYEPVPTQQFGIAMLRGRGSTAWKCSKDGSSSRRGRARERGGSTGAPPSAAELEPEVAAAVPRGGGSTRRGRVRVRGGCSRASVAPALREGAVQVARGGAARGRATQAGPATGSDRTGPRTE